METKVVSVARMRPCEVSDIVDGDYKGVWGGYVVESIIDSVVCHFHTDVGVKGINIPCVVCIRDGEATVRVSERG